MTGQSLRSMTVDTPVARPVQSRRLITRRTFVLGGFWSSLFLVTVGIFGAPLDFAWPRNLGLFGRPQVVTAAQVPSAGADPVRFPLGRFYLSHLAPGQEGSEGGILAVYQKCTHLGCTVPWQPDFVFKGTKGWYRCPCHGSTYTKGAAILVFGPAPRPLDTMAVEVAENGDVTVYTGKITRGGADNPRRAVPYNVRTTGGRA